MSGVSYWLDTAGELTPRPALHGSASADVAIVGAGYTGLWTAWYLLRREPSARVVVCEARFAGFGASGRNGAWCSPGIAVSPSELARRISPEAARRTVHWLRQAVDEIGVVCAEQRLDIDYRKGGILRIARGAHEVPLMERSWAGLRQLDLDEGWAVLDSVALARRVRVAGARAALFDPYGATIHPGRLVRGLADLVERAGACIYEQTPVTAVETGPRPVVRAPNGDVRAGTVVLATEAWLSRLPGFRRAVLPLYSLVVLTEPLSDEQWAAIGWRGHECLSSHRYTVDYLSRTTDGRVLFGGRGAPYHFGSRIEPAFDRHERTHALLREQLVEWFPALRGVRFAGAWGGPLGVPRDWMPTFLHDPARGLAGAWGYTGQGVAAANLAGRALADLITGTDSELTRLPMVGHRSPRWEPEPLRWLATRYLQRELARIDERGRRTGRAPTGRTLAERLVRR